MPIYEITTKDEDGKRLVKAESAAQAIRHCSKDRFTARTVGKPEDVADLMAGGITLETAGADPVEAESK